MTYIVLGAGQVGIEISKILKKRGEKFIVIARTRREILPDIFTTPAKAQNSSELANIEKQPTAIINCLNAPYTKWKDLFPPLGRGPLEYALKHSAPIVSVSNLYMYESTLGPIGVNTPKSSALKKGQIRQQMWDETLVFISRGLQASEVRASDYIVSGQQSPLGDRFIPNLIKNRPPTVIGNPNAKHSWTAPIDVARTCLAIIDNKEFGDVWHVPTNAPKSFQEVADEVCELINASKISVKSLPKPIFYLLGVFMPIVKELRETAYQFDDDFIIDDSKTREILKIQPTDWSHLVGNLVSQYRN